MGKAAKGKATAAGEIRVRVGVTVRLHMCAYRRHIQIHMCTCQLSISGHTCACVHVYVHGVRRLPGYRCAHVHWTYPAHECLERGGALPIRGGTIDGEFKEDQIYSGAGGG